MENDVLFRDVESFRNVLDIVLLKFSEELIIFIKFLEVVLLVLFDFMLYSDSLGAFSAEDEEGADLILDVEFFWEEYFDWGGQLLLNSEHSCW